MKRAYESSFVTDASIATTAAIFIYRRSISADGISATGILSRGDHNENDEIRYRLRTHQEAISRRWGGEQFTVEMKRFEE